MNNNLKTQGFFLIDVDAVALNNAGKGNTSNFDNEVVTKSITKNGRSFVYVSGQAVRYWWRNTLLKDYGWKLSPVIREKKNVAFTSVNPIDYPDDDIFGYMRATKEEEIDENGNVKKDKKGKNIKSDATVTRVSPLKNSVLISACSVRAVENFSSMSRIEGDPILYSKQEYSAIMKGMFCLDLGMIGTFSNYNKTGFKNLSDSLRRDALAIEGAEEIDDAFVANQKLVRLPYSTRVQRAKDTISALKTISGGAMQTSNMGDVTPKFIILVSTNTGNHPFSHIVTSTGNYDEMIKFDIEALREVIKEYGDTFEGKVFIGRRKGFFDDYHNALDDLKKELPEIIEYGAVNEMIDAYCKQIEEQMK